MSRKIFIVVVFLSVVILAGVKYLNPSTLPEIKISVDKSTYTPGDTLTLSISISNPGTAVPVEIYIVLQLPDGSLYSYVPNLDNVYDGNFMPVDTSNLSTLNPAVRNLTLSAGLTLTDFTIFKLSFSQGINLPSGNYIWYAAFAEPGTLNFIGGISSATFSYSTGGNGGIIGDKIELKRVAISGKTLESGYLNLTFNKEMEERKFINIVVDLNKDGKWEKYSTNGKTQEEWIVQNMPARISDKEPNSYSFAFNDFDADTRQNLKSKVILTGNTIDSSSYPNGWDGTAPKDAIDQKELTISAIASDDIGDLYAPDPAGLGDTGLPGGLIAGLVTQEVAPAASINVFNSDVPDITQGRNECVPTSTANSLLWLAKKHSFEDKMPASNNDLISELKTDLNWSADAGVYTASTLDKDNPDNYLAGKQRFTERRGIPIETHQIGGKFDLGIFEKMGTELQKGQDVEITVEYGEYYTDDAGQQRYRRRGGHMVTVVGAWTAGENKYLDIHDPASRGPGTLDIYRIDGTRVVDYRFQGSYVTYIRFAIAESPFVPPASLIADNSVSCRITLTWKDNTESEDGFLIERRESGSQTWTQIASVGQNVTSYTNAYVTDGTLRGGVTYCYRVRAYKGTTYSTYSNESCAVKQ